MVAKFSFWLSKLVGLKFENIYGDYSKSKNFIEAHHIKTKESAKKQLKIGESRKVKKEDFAILCANCHRMIHRKKKMMLSLDELRDYYNDENM